MDCSCNCFGIAASSKVPVKRYNLLVPDIFPRHPPPFDQALDASILRKIKKIGEYVSCNPHRAPKVSRRLARRINAELRKPTHHGYVHLAVEAYIQLLHILRPEDNALLAREIIVQPVSKSSLPVPEGTEGPHMNSVVGVLLRFPSPAIQTLGARLLTAFIQAQRDSEHITTLDRLVPVLTRNIAETSGTGRNFSNPSQDRLASACLSTLHYYIDFCKRVSYATPNLDQIEDCLLDVVARTYPPPTSSDDAGKDESPYTVASQTLEELFMTTKDAANGKRVVELCLLYMDKGHHWLEKNGIFAKASAIMHKVFEEDQQRYLWYSSLIRHVSSPGLSLEERAAVVSAASAEGGQMEGALAASALLLALKTLPGVLPGEGRTVAEQALRAAMLAGVRTWAGNVGDSLHLLEALGGVVSKLPPPSPARITALDCLIAAAAAIPDFPPQGRVLPSATFPQVLLREITGLMTQGPAAQRIRTHDFLTQLLPVATDGLHEQPAHAVFSALWHSTEDPDMTPRLAVSIDRLMGTILKRASGATLLDAARLALSWHADVAAGRSGRLGQLPDTGKLALLALESSVLARIYLRAHSRNGGAVQAHAPPASGLLVANEVELVEDKGGPPTTADSLKGSSLLESVSAEAPSGARSAVLSRLCNSRLLSNGIEMDKSLDSILAQPFSPLPLTALHPRASGPGNPAVMASKGAAVIVKARELPSAVPRKPRELARRRSSVEVISQGKGTSLLDVCKILDSPEPGSAAGQGDTAAAAPRTFSEVASLCAADRAPMPLRPGSQHDRPVSVPVARPATLQNGPAGIGSPRLAPLGPAAILGSSNKVFSLFSMLEGPPRTLAA